MPTYHLRAEGPHAHDQETVTIVAADDTAAMLHARDEVGDRGRFSDLWKYGGLTLSREDVIIWTQEKEEKNE